MRTALIAAVAALTISAVPAKADYQLMVRIITLVGGAVQAVETKIIPGFNSLAACNAAASAIVAPGALGNVNSNISQACYLVN